MNKIRPLEREQETDDFAERERIPNVLPKLRKVSAEKRAVGRRARIVRFRMMVDNEIKNLMGTRISEFYA